MSKGTFPLFLILAAIPPLVALLLAQVLEHQLLEKLIGASFLPLSAINFFWVLMLPRSADKKLLIPGGIVITAAAVLGWRILQALQDSETRSIGFFLMMAIFILSFGNCAFASARVPSQLSKAPYWVRVGRTCIATAIYVLAFCLLRKVELAKLTIPVAGLYVFVDLFLFKDVHRKDG